MKDSRGCSFLSFLCCLLFTFPSLTHATPAFIQAAQEGRLDLIQELLKNPKENVNDQDEQGRTALMVASENGHLQIVQRLLEKNADLRLIDRQGRTALDWARIQGHSAILQLLDEKWESSKTLHPGNPPWAKDSPLWESDQRILKNPEDRKVEKKISGAQEGEENPIEGGARLIELKPQDLGYQFVKTYFEQSQKESAQHGLNGLSAFQIQKVQLIDNPLYEKLFLEAAQVLRQRQGNMAFDPHADQTADRELRKKVFDFFSDKSNPYSPSDHSCTFIPVWHGTKKEVLPSILKTGFANLAKTDVGYYGKGIYGSTNAEYVKRVYSGGYHKGVLLLNWAAVYSAYPVVGKQDIEDLKGKGNRENYDGHYIAVKPRNPFAHLRRTEGTYFPLTQVDEQPSYDELVVFDGSHVLARYRVEIERTIPELQTAKDYFDWAKTLADDEKVRLPSSEVVDKATLFQKALQLSTQLQTPRGSSVWKIFSLGKPEKAEEDLEDFISGIKDELGGLLLRKEEATPEELKEAKKYFEEAIAPGNKSRTSLASPYFHLAQVLVRLKNTHSSLERPRTGHLPARKSEPMSIEEVASQTVALDEKKPHPEYLLFLASLKSRDLQISLEEQEAFQLIQKALHLDSGFPQAYDLLGQLLYANEKVSVVTLKKPVTQEGQSPETETLTLTARECFKKAIALDEDYYPAYVHLGEYLRRNEKPGTKVKLEFPVDQELTARGLFEYAIEKNPQCSLGYARLAQGVSGDLVELNRSKTRDFLRKFFKKQQSEALPSMSAQDLGELAYCLDKRNSISSIAFASTLGKKKRGYPMGCPLELRNFVKRRT